MSPTDDPFRKLRHDIKGSLNSLVLCVEVLSDRLEPDEALDFLDSLTRAADKMAGYMDQIPYDQLQPGQQQQPSSQHAR